LIDDDAQNLSLLGEILATRYTVTATTDPAKGVQKVLASPPDILVVDIDMPVMNGFEVCEEIRASKNCADLAIIFLTSDANASSMQKALNLGANDYLVKPFRAAELLNRVENRLGQMHVGAPVRCGNLVVDPALAFASLQLGKRRKREFRISGKGFRILQLLVQNKGRILSREQILNHLGSADTGSDRSVDIHITRIRRLLSGWNHRIESIYSKGYTVIEK